MKQMWRNVNKSEVQVKGLQILTLLVFQLFCQLEIFENKNWRTDRRNPRPCQPVEGAGEGNTGVASGFGEKLASSDPFAGAFQGNGGQTQSRVGWAGGQQRGRCRLRWAAQRRKAGASAPAELSDWAHRKGSPQRMAVMATACNLEAAGSARRLVTP